MNYILVILQICLLYSIITPASRCYTVPEACFVDTTAKHKFAINVKVFPEYYKFSYFVCSLRAA